MSTPENKARVSEMDTVRTAQRAILLEPFNQRERDYLHQIFPSDTRRIYTTDLKPQGPQGIDERTSPIVYLDDLAKLVSPFEYERKPGDRFKLLFGLATTAETPEEVINIIRGAATLYSAWEPHDIANRSWYSFRGFLDHQNSNSIPEMKQSDKGKFLVEEIIRFSDKTAMGVRNAKDAIQEVGKTYFDKGTDFETYAKKRRYLGEALMYLLISGSYSQEWVSIILEGSLKFDFGGTFQGTGLKNPSIFDRDTSFWDVVNGSWVGIGDFKIKIPENPENEYDSEAKKHKTADQALDDLRKEFHRAKVDWYNEKTGLNLTITDISLKLSGLQEANSRLIKEKDALRQRAETAERELIAAKQKQWVQPDKTTGAPSKQTEDIVSDFLGIVGYTRLQIATMDAVKRSGVITKLKRLAGYSFHPNNGISPNEATLKLINEFLNQHDPRLSSTRLSSTNR